MKLLIHSQISNLNGYTIEAWEWISNFIPPLLQQAEHNEDFQYETKNCVKLGECNFIIHRNLMMMYISNFMTDKNDITSNDATIMYQCEFESPWHLISTILAEK